jgi:hypothetical protein
VPSILRFCATSIYFFGPARVNTKMKRHFLPFFQIKPWRSSALLMPQNFKLQLDAQLMTKTGNPVPEGLDISFANNLLFSLFSNMEFQIGYTAVGGGNDFFPFKSYMHNLLAFDYSAKSTWLESQVQFKFKKSLLKRSLFYFHFSLPGLGARYGWLFQLDGAR